MHVGPNAQAWREQQRVADASGAEEAQEENEEEEEEVRLVASQ
jgi:hypothetical protein